MDKLPIIARKAEIISAIEANKVVIVTGATGCGKTSQLPLILYEMGLHRKGIIAIAEPRRAAAVSVAEHVAAQMGSELGDRVGYRVRFGNVSVSGTAIKFLTNGILLREMLSGSLFERYSAVIIDEAHERSLETDLLIGLAKRAARIRDDFRVVIASATLDVEAFSKYFDNAPIIDIPGRQFPVTISYHRRTLPRIDWMIRAVAKRIMAILQETKEGDILAFMPGRESIEGVIAEIWSLGGGRIITLPFHKDMEDSEYRRIFEEFPGMRKVIVATNIAETSLTLPSAKFVVDSGLIKEITYSPKLGIESLAIVPHSQSGCLQRSGRVGRTSEGVCHRLYPEPSFPDRPPHTKPEIVRRRLDAVMLYLKALGFENPASFDFLDQPDKTVFDQAREELVHLGAISASTSELTNAGKVMADLPLVPRVGRLVVEAIKRGCVREIITYASFLAAPSIFLRPWENKEKSRRVHRSFATASSDILTLLKVWQGYADSGYSKAWCEEHFLCSRGLAEVGLVREQLMRVLLERGVKISSNPSEDVLVQVAAASLHAYLLKHQGRGAYRGVFRDFGEVHIHPESALSGSSPEYLVATNIIKVSRSYAVQCTAVSKEMMARVFPRLLEKPKPAAVDETGPSEEVLLKAVQETVEIAQKIAVDRGVTLVFVKRGGSLVALYQGAILSKFEPSSMVPVPGKLYSCDVYSEEGTLSLMVVEEVVPGKKVVKTKNPDCITVEPTKSKIDPRIEVSEETVDLAHDLASSWECRLND